MNYREAFMFAVIVSGLATLLLGQNPSFNSNLEATSPQIQSVCIDSTGCLKAPRKAM